MKLNYDQGWDLAVIMAGILISCMILTAVLDEPECDPRHTVCEQAGAE